MRDKHPSPFRGMFVTLYVTVQRGRADMNTKPISQRERLVREWLHHIEAFPDEIEQVVERCRNDPEARNYFLTRANEGAEVRRQNHD